MRKSRVSHSIFVLGFVALVGVLLNSPSAEAAKKAKKSGQTQNVETASAQVNQALGLVRAKQYQQAVPLLYTLSRRPEYAKEHMQIKYALGTSLLELGLNQIAAFQFVEVIKDAKNRYVRQAIEKLSLAADALGDDTLLNYAVSKIKVDEIPETGRDLIYFRLGEIKMRLSEFPQAIEVFNRVPPASRYGFLSRYNKAASLLELGKPKEAISIFKELVASRSGTNVTDTNRTVAMLGLARAYYQATDWENSVAAYREIPRDHPLWHDVLFESTWANLRAAKFRSALSNFQSLHSAYYDDFYIPESLLLRAIVYLYICKYDEMEKVLSLFTRQYGPVRAQMNQFLGNVEPTAYFQEVEAANNLQSGRLISQNKPKLPLKVDYRILREGDVKRGFTYLRALNDEKNRLESMPNLMRSPIAAVGRKILGNRYKNAKVAIGEMVKAHLVDMKADLRDLYEQAEFIRYEMINGQKEQLKKRIAGKDVPGLVNESIDRSMYVQNGYEYYPFNGEYWLDEIGNYHYLGKQSCE